MNASRVIITVIFIITLTTSSAHAQNVRLAHLPHTFDAGLDESMIVGLTACTPALPNVTQTCLPIETTDQLAGRFDARTQQSGKDGWRTAFTFYKFHPLRPTLYYASGSVGIFIPDDGTGPVIQYVSMPTYDPARNAPDCTGGPWVIHLADGSIVATDTAPQEYVDACKLRRQSEAPQESSPEQPAPITAAPVRTTTCAAITYTRKRVAVTSTGLECDTARVVLARFLTRGAKPRGWTCVKMLRAATCSNATKKVVGRWR